MSYRILTRIFTVKDQERPFITGYFKDRFEEESQAKEAIDTFASLLSSLIYLELEPITRSDTSRIVIAGELARQCMFTFRVVKD